MDKARRVSVALGVLFVDQWIGDYVLRTLQPSEGRWEGVSCHPLLSFNPSLAWGGLPGTGNVPAMWGVALSAAVAAVVIRVMIRARGIAAWAWALLLGGLLVGIVDRLRFHAVMDYVICKNVTFNGGDAAGVIALALLVFSGGARLLRRRKNNEEDFSRQGQGSV